MTAQAAGMVCLFGQCVCAHPVSFRQVSQSSSNGIIHFKYAWDSNTGNLNDLNHCDVGQRVTYPASPGADFIFPSPPYVAGVLSRNPLETLLPGTLGQAQDTHGHPMFLPPYAPGGVVEAQQQYFYQCLCLNARQSLQIQSIIRNVAPQGNGWEYTITKSGVTGTIDPLP
jgi:hypothetical protein